MKKIFLNLKQLLQIPWKGRKAILEKSKYIIDVVIGFLLTIIIFSLVVIIVFWIYFFIAPEANISIFCLIEFIKEKLKLDFPIISSGLVAAIGLRFFLRRLENQQAQIDLQIEQRTDERFTTAVNLLGSNETSARTGAIYSLYHLALEEEKYRKEVAQILCSHIRSKTNEQDYQKNHKNRPSNEIQTTIDLLVRDTNGNTGIYCQDFAQNEKFPTANFAHAYLVTAIFFKAQCQNADFRFAQCQEAYFYQAQCQGAIFTKAQCQEVYFTEAQCQGANFIYAQCQGAYFDQAQCQGASFFHTQCQGASFFHTKCQGASFFHTKCQGTDFSQTQYQGASFYTVQCQGAYAKESFQKFVHRIGKNTELENMLFSGKLDEKTIASIEAAKKYLSTDWHQKIQKIIYRNKDKEPDYTIPEDIITGILEDNEENQAIAEKNWEKLKQIQKNKKNSMI